MSFSTYLSQAWEQHALETENVAQNLMSGVQLIENSEQITQMAQLIAHVLGEHMGEWEKGIETLQVLKKHQFVVKGSEEEGAIDRSITALQLASGRAENLRRFSSSDQVRILALAASALAERDPGGAQGHFQRALEIARGGFEKEDPANRALAVTGNNIAASLGEKSSLSSHELELMILAAQTARKFWEIAGTWIHVERAEYRLAMSFLKSGDVRQALIHAQNCLKIIEQNQGEPLEAYFGYEALALAERARGNLLGYQNAATRAREKFEVLRPEDKPWVQESLNRLI
ncbi:MAG TPA: hypothetical protein VFV50_03935 [Bdellovibrionales bacterium]|nr:hypothetical protein [Bdellovibrionales bacterium]